MASTEALQLVSVGEEKIAGCMALSAEAGWNQTADDWALFMRRGTVFGVPDAAGRPVATGAILPYPDNFAWISMVLVTASRRGARIGTRILETCCAELTQRGLVAVLDATPAGERVYRPLGFEPLFKLTRWQGESGGRGCRAEPPAGIRRMAPDDLATVVASDAAAFGAERSFLLESFFRRAPQLAFLSEEGNGFVLARPGRLATHIGPLVAADESYAAALLYTALDAISGPVFLDLCDRWDGLVRLLEQRRFTVQRPFLRMALGRSTPFGDVEHSFVIASPEFG
jgi:ribosomal protein S18 acetylase RimI-like enzyme/GNAT superfamily N-acetyltransferase